MNKPIFVIRFLLLLVCLTAASGVFAQSDKRDASADPCYEIVLQIVAGTNAPAGRAALPATLAAPVKKLKSLYAFTDYRLSETYFQRTAGFVEYRSVIENFGRIGDQTRPAFLDWSIRNIRALPDARGRSVLQIDNFRFGLRVPVAAVRRGEGPAAAAEPFVNYESIGLNSARVTVADGEPTVIGSLPSAVPGELLFVVLTVRPAE